MTEPKKNYLQNRDLLRNLLLSKASYTWYIDGNMKNTRYLDYDVIFCGSDTYQESKDKLVLQFVNKRRLEKNEKRVSAMKDAYLKYLKDEDYEEIDSRIVLFDPTLEKMQQLDMIKLGHYNRKLYEEGKKRIKEITDEVRQTVDLDDIVVRVFTFEHIPHDPQKIEEKCKKESDYHEKLNFPPYQHYAFHDGVFQCVAMSHYDTNKEFAQNHGQINMGLSMAYMKLCQRYASRYNWRGYSYCEDMQAQALFQLVTVGLQFNELFSSNPFSYFTSTVKNAFTITYNEEKTAQDIRDNLLVGQNQSPSSTKQLENELTRTEHWDRVLDNNHLESGDVSHMDIDTYRSESENEDEDDYNETDIDMELTETEEEINYNV